MSSDTVQNGRPGETPAPAPETKTGRPRIDLKNPTHRRAIRLSAIFAVLAIAIGVLVAVWDWNWFRGPVERMASARLHRQVTISGDLRVHLFSWQPSASVDGITIANPAWAAGNGKLAKIDRIVVKIRLIPLLGGHVDMQRLEFDQPTADLYRDSQGRATWDFSDGKKTDQPLRLPPIHNFIIRNGRLSYRDVKREITFNGVINAHERLGRANHGFELTGQGVMNRAPFTLQVTGGPLLNIDRAKPYPFDAEIRAGQTYVTAKGDVPRPFDLGVFHMNATARGPDLADLYAITGVPLPNTPPYDLKGRLSRDEHLWRLDGVSGRVGSSDLAGSMAVKTGGKRPDITADLHSNDLLFADLGALFGGAPKHGPAASPQQVVEAQKLQAAQRIFPDATLNFTKIRAVDADVRYSASHIRGAPASLTSGSVHVKLDDGLLRADPLKLALPQGQIAGWIQLNARHATPATDLDLRLTNARLEQFVPVTIGGSQPFAGAIVGRAKLHGVGDSVHKAFASADGQVMLVVPGGEIRRAFAELMGVDVVKGLGLLLSKNEQSTPIRCGVAHFTTTGGVMTADRLVFDTGPVLVTGSGSINLGTERLDLQAQGHPKKFQLVRLQVPVTAEGPLLHPKLGVQAGKAIAQGGAAAALGAVLSPLAAILPFIDPGLAKDANCGALVAEASAHGAPVKGAAPARTAHR